MINVGIINYGCGNIASVRNAIEHLGHEVLEIDSPEKLRDAQRLILPGVGSFPAAMLRLKQLGFVDPIRAELAEHRKPFLGICLGMQLLADIGFEHEQAEGLGLIGGSVEKIEAQEHGLPVPHMGWNDLQIDRESPLFENLSDEPSFYFVHSYRFEPNDEANRIASCNYGDRFCVSVQHENIFGVQFHPEKSQRDGLTLLDNFCHWN